MSRQFRWMPATLAAIVVAVACTPAASPSPSEPAGSPTESPMASDSPSASGPADAVRLALDWTPNTNHTGFYVAQSEGWYDEARIKLDILPYTGTAPETLLAAHQADCGISFQDSLTFAVAKGADITSVMAILQHAASAIAVLDDSPITRPKDLDGKIYASFGYPNEVPTVKAVIQADGGTGTFDTVILDTAAYEALYAKRADFTITFTAWEGIEAKRRGIPLRYFQFTDYGFPDFYQVVLACDRRFLDAKPDVARRFVAASVRGWEMAHGDPGRSASILVAQNPGVFPDTLLPLESARFLSDGGFLVDKDGQVGRQTAEQWAGYSGFLYEQGLLTDADGKPLASPPDYGRLFTNDFLP
jgi:ABC-type nitrate/sulfonate/bicarbonate transport system substrate-binding protein